MSAVAEEPRHILFSDQVPRAALGEIAQDIVCEAFVAALLSTLTIGWSFKVTREAVGGPRKINKDSSRR